MENILFILGCLIPVTYCGYTDYKTGLIYNKVTVPMILAGICYSAYISKLQDSLLGLAIGFAILMICALMGGVGGGDVKLAAALGSWYGFNVVWVLLFGSMLCVVWGGLKLQRQGKLKQRASVFFKGLFYRIIYGVKGALILPKLPEDDTVPDDVIPYGTCLALASWVICALI
jgi:Flp pilus assembly protein protease CpaA